MTSSHAYPTTSSDVLVGVLRRRRSRDRLR
ncbi:hypothetical protein GA0070603_4216 [Micromonospora chersina]|uniref:Uncharacterized protein n=1 Tax=Micromonospora chersina TaxID=47854 RepID=A0A1C6VKT1_9ACTN|nr:hypothetical protein GA0070603_4216 [Micromonospora chersina]